MTPSHQVLVLQDGNHLLRLRLSDVATRLGISPERILAAMRGGQVVDRSGANPWEGGKGGGPRYDRSNVQNNIYQTYRYRAPPSHEVGWTQGYARELALALGDEANLGALMLLATRYPRELLEEALRRTLAIPDEHIWKSRGACFTAIVRILARDQSRSLQT